MEKKFVNYIFCKNTQSFRMNKFILSIPVCMFLVSSVNAYTEMGVMGNTNSWESAEYKKDWGLISMNASTAYALGVTGKGVKLGVMDSGILMSHPEFQDGRFFTVETKGEYGKNGIRYPDARFGNAPFDKNQLVRAGKKNYDRTNNGEFKKGEAFNVGGEWIKGVNDAHGTHVGGTIAASRDGSEMHGIAFNSLLYTANTGGNDNMTYGPNQDYNYFFKGYSALADAGVHFINNSWGSNRRVGSAFPGAEGYKRAEIGNTTLYGQPTRYYTTVTTSNELSAHMYLKDLDSAKKAYYPFVTSGEKSFIDAAYDVAVNRQVVQVFTAGNRALMKEAFTRAMLPYFRPDAENYWVNVTGQRGSQAYPNLDPNIGGSPITDAQQYNEAGHSKWWTIAAPSNNIYSGYIELENDANYGKALYDSKSGTSMAAPHVTGALGVIQQRYMYMTPSQIREVMLTNARQVSSRPDASFGQPLERWGTQGLGAPSEVWGWGILDLGKAMFGPGQLLGNFDVTMNEDDIWSNSISDVAIKFRRTEDANEAATWNARKAVLTGMVSLTPEEKAELTFETAREKARADRMVQGYEGALIKRGSGTLTLTGDNTFTGKTTIHGGKISALNQSIGNSSQIDVENGGSLEILKSVEVITPSSTGFQTATKDSDTTTVKGTIKNGGTFVVNDGVANLNLKFEDGSLIENPKESITQLEHLDQNPASKILYDTTGNFVDPDKAKLNNIYAFFDLEKEIMSNSNIRLALKKNANNMTTFANTNNENAIGGAIQSSPNSSIYRRLLAFSPAQIQNFYNMLSSDLEFEAQNNAIISSVSLKNGILNQTDMKRANIDTGVELWLSGSMNRIVSDETSSQGKLSTNTNTQLIGIDFLVGSGSKFGIFAGKGNSNNKIADTKEAKSKNTHFGIHGDIDFSPVKVKIGSIYTKSNRDRKFVDDTLNSEYLDSDENIFTTFAEVSYSGLTLGNVNIEPYGGVSYIHSKTDGINNSLVNVSNESRDLEVATIGVRPSIPFTIGFVELRAKADIAYNQFFGDKTPESYMKFKDAGTAHLKGKELKNLTTLDLGVEAAFTKNMKFSLSYVGAYNSNAKSNGVNAKFSISF